MKNADRIIGIDLGGTQMRAGLVEGDEIVKQEKVLTPKQPQNAQETIDVLTGLIESVFSNEVRAIGLGVPSLVDRRKGIIYNTVNIPHWDGIHLKDILEKRFSVPVYVDNDANCFALAERFYGVGRSFDHFAGMTIGTGLGTGVILNGKLWAGVNCGAGEFGMLPYRDNILEYYSSGSYFMNVWGIDGKEMYARAKAGDPVAKESFVQLGLHLAAAVKIVMYAVDVEMIVFGGSVAAVHELYAESLWENLKDFGYPRSLEKLNIFYSELENPGILGAAALTFESCSG